MYEIFEKLLKKNNVKTSDVSRATKISASTFSDWKNGVSQPKPDKLLLIAEYFNVSVDYLMTGKEPTIEEKFEEKYAILIKKIRNDKKLSNALLKYFALSDKEKSHVIETINLLSEVKKWLQKKMY